MDRIPAPARMAPMGAGMRRVHRKTLVWLCILAGVSALVVWGYPREPHLLAQARRVGDTGEWHLFQLPLIRYRWLSGHEVLFLGGDAYKGGYMLIRRDL